MLRKTVYVLVLVAAVFGWQQQQRRTEPRAAAPGTVTLRVQFGVTDRMPRAWDGLVTAPEGDIVRLRNWRPRPGDRVDQATWVLATREGPMFASRAWEKEPTAPPPPYVTVPGLIVDVSGRAENKLSFQTKNGNFDVRPADVKTGVPVSLLNGAVVVDRIAEADSLSASDTESEFPTVAAGPGGEAWVAWVAFKDSGNQVMARRFDGKAWSEPQKISESHSDIYQVRIAYAKNALWAVWSAQVNDNWDLYARRYDGRAWSTVQKITDDPQPDINQRVAADSAGNLWVTWQGFRSGKSDVFTRRNDGSQWAAAERVSTSPANDWDPAIATDSAGRVWIAWDTYDKGNYDVAARRYEGGKWSEPMAIASTPKFEAHVTLACDKQNRLWAAWNESGFEWGKDTGFLVRKAGTQLYEWRGIGIAVYANGAWQEPSAPLDTALPVDLREFNDLPELTADATGRVWLFFRHRLLRIRDVPYTAPAHRAAWEIFGTSYDGNRWTAPVAVPFSHGRTETRGEFAAHSNGALWGAWSTDNRDFEEFLFTHAEVYAGQLPSMGAPRAPELKARVQPQFKAFPVHENEAADLKRIRDYTLQSEGKTYRIFRGDTHRHTEFSMDGNYDGSLLEAYRYAIDAAELDFLGVSEHNGAGGPDSPYINWLLQQRVDIFHVAGKFTPLFVYERSVGYPNGHRNVIFAKRGNPTLPIPASEQMGADGAKALYDYLKKRGGIAISHTSATNMGTDWRDNDPEVEPLVEIYQGDRTSAEYEGAPRASWRGNPASAPGGFRPAGFVWNAWAKGYKLGVQSSSDHLSTHLSYACTIATDFTREGLVNAMRKRHSYGATDNIILDYRMQTGGREYLQGDILEAPGEIRLSVKVVGTQPIRQIDIVRNNKFLHNVNPLEREVNLTFVDSQPLEGESYYYVRVLQVDEQMAWSSPIWIKR